MFPDARTTRGQKHLQELISLREDDARAIIFFVIQRTDACRFAPADAIDPDYGRWLRRAAEKKVEIVTYDVAVDRQGIALNGRIPLAL